MTRATLDTGDHGIQLQLEYGSLKDSATGGAITADTTRVKFSNLEAWIDGNGYPFYDSSNSLEASGGWVLDDTWHNINIDTKNTQKLKELSPQNQDIKFGSTGGSAEVRLKLYSVAASGYMGGAKSWTIPRRPYHAPPTLGVSAVMLSTVLARVSISGLQTDDSADYYTETVDWWLSSESGAASYTALEEGAPNTTTYKDIEIAANTRYSVTVNAENTDEVGASSSTGMIYGTPSAPSDVVATRAIGSTSVALSWVNNAMFVGTYQVYRRLNGAAETLLKTVTGTSTTDTLPVGSYASYSIVAVTPTGVNTSYSINSPWAAVPVGYNIPAAPTVSLTRAAATTVSLAIGNAQSNPALDKYTEYSERAIDIDGAGFGAPSTGAAAGGSYTHTGMPLNSRIQGRARWVNAAGASAWVNSGYIYTTPDAPSGFAAARVDPASATVHMSWTNNAPWANLVLLERSVNDGATWTQVASYAPGTTEVDVTLSQASAALYRLRCVTSDSQYSAYSETQSVAVAFVSNKSKARLGAGQLDYCYVGDVRVRRILKGTTVIWEDGDA